MFILVSISNHYFIISNLKNIYFILNIFKFFQKVKIDINNIVMK